MLQVNDLKDYVDLQTKLITEITDSESLNFSTIKAKIKRMKEITTVLIQKGYYGEDKKIGHLRSIIIEVLKPYNPSFIVNRSGWFYELFEEHESNKDNANLAQNISSLPIEKQTGNKIIDKLKEIERNGFEIPETKQYNYLKLIVDTSNETNKQALSIISKYGNALSYCSSFDREFNDIGLFEKNLEQSSGKLKKDLQERYDAYRRSQQIIYDIEDSLKNKDEKEIELRNVFAEQKAISKQLDERNKITFVEKWNIILCESCKSILGISAIAKRLGIDKKHISNNIKPKENPVTKSPNLHHEYIDWFRAVRIRSPSGEDFIFDMKDWADRQIERKKLDLPFDTLVLKTHDIE